MNYPELLRKKELYQAGRTSIPELTLASYEQTFEIEYTHNSKAIEGNTLTHRQEKDFYADLADRRLDQYPGMIEQGQGSN